jgi:hypothetical protein
MAGIYINPAVSNNRGDGASLGNAWRDLDELSRRLGRGTARFMQPVTITIAGTPPTTDVLNLAIASAPGANVRIEGTPTIVGSGTFTAVQGINRATQTMQNVTDSSQDFTAHLHRMMVIVGGARDGAYTSIAKILNSPTSTNVRTGRWVVPNRSGPGASLTVVPQVGDAYNILTFPTVKVGNVMAESGSQAIAATNYLNFHNLELDQYPTVTPSIVGDLIVNVTACTTIFTSWDVKFIRLAGCRIAHSTAVSSTLTNSSSPSFTSCVLERPISDIRSHIFLDKDTLIQGNVFDQWTVPVGSYLDIGTACMFDALDGVSFQVDGTLRTYTLGDGTDLLWGTGNSHVYVNSNGALLYETRPTINGGQGVGNELRVGARELVWGDIPFHDNDRGGIVAVMQHAI